MNVAYAVFYGRKEYLHQFMGIGHGDAERAITKSGAAQSYPISIPLRQLAQSQNTLYRIEVLVRRGR
jgi:hypothetical protein